MLFSKAITIFGKSLLHIFFNEPNRERGTGQFFGIESGLRGIEQVPQQFGRLTTKVPGSMRSYHLCMRTCCFQTLAPRPERNFSLGEKKSFRKKELAPRSVLSSRLQNKGNSPTCMLEAKKHVSCTYFILLIRFTQFKSYCSTDFCKRT